MKRSFVNGGVVLGAVLAVLMACGKLPISKIATNVRSEPKAAPAAPAAGPADEVAGLTDPTPTSAGAKGFDMSGAAATCSPSTPSLICTMDYQPGDAFAAECKAAGGIANKCSCHNYLCSKNLRQTVVKGFNLHGRAASCMPVTQPIPCTKDFRIGDQFRRLCVDAGATPTMCGCHNYLCSKDLGRITFP